MHGGASTAQGAPPAYARAQKSIALRAITHLSLAAAAQLRSRFEFHSSSVVRLKPAWSRRVCVTAIHGTEFFSKDASDARPRRHCAGTGQSPARTLAQGGAQWQRDWNREPRGAFRDASASEQKHASAG